MQQSWRGGMGGARPARRQPHLQEPEAEGSRGWGTGTVWAAGLAASGQEGLSRGRLAKSQEAESASGQTGSGGVFRPADLCPHSSPPHLAASLQSRGRSLGEKREGRGGEVTGDSPEHPQVKASQAPRGPEHRGRARSQVAGWGKGLIPFPTRRNKGTYCVNCAGL